MEINQFLIYVLISRNKLINIIRRTNQLLIHSISLQFYEKQVKEYFKTLKLIKKKTLQ